MINIGSKVIRDIYSLKINTVIKTLIISYTIILAGWGMITPIIAVFIVENIPGAGVETVGFAITIYALTRSLIQLPIARFLDLKKGEKDEFYTLMLGTIIVGLAALGYLKVNSIATLYLIQIAYGLGDALIYPSWGSLFASHIDKNNRATETSLYQTSADFTSAISASLGALLVAKFSYQLIFTLVGISTFIGALSLIPMYWDLNKVRSRNLS